MLVTMIARGMRRGVRSWAGCPVLAGVRGSGSVRSVGFVTGSDKVVGPLVYFPSDVRGLRAKCGVYRGVSQKHTGRGGTRGTVPIYIYLYTHSVSPTHTTSLTTQ